MHSRDASNAERFAAEFGIPGSTSDYAALLANPTIDAVYIATPFATHHSMAQQALLAGKHVLVEKPMAMNAAEVSDLFATAARQGVFLMEAMWFKFGPAFVRLQQEIAAGTIGVPRNIQAAFSIPFPADGGSKWDVTRSGGALLDQGIYAVTIAHDIFGVPETIHAVGAVRDDGLDVAEHFTFEYAEGQFAQCASGMAEFADMAASVAGTRGWIRLTAPFWATTTLSIHAGSISAMFGAPEPVELAREGNGYVPMLRAVVGAISAGLVEHPDHTAADTVAVFESLDAIFEQIRPAHS